VNPSRGEAAITFKMKKEKKRKGKKGGRYLCKLHGGKEKELLLRRKNSRGIQNNARSFRNFEAIVELGHATAMNVPSSLRF
jgi:hypothetical protein